MGVAAALLSACAWAAGSILFRRIGDRAPPAAMTLAKGLLGLLGLGVGVLVAGITPMDQGSVLRLVGSGLLGIAVGDTLFFMALVRLDPRRTVLLATVGQAFTVLLAVLLLGESPSGSAWVGLAAVLGGVAWVMREGTAPGEAPIPGGRLGIAAGVLSALASSVALLLAKSGVAEVPTLQATWVRLAAGVVGVALWSGARGELGAHLRVFTQPGFLREIVVGVAVVMIGGFWLSLVALKYADAWLATALSSTEPLFVLPLAAFWLGERVSARAVAGALVAVAGVALIVWR